MSHVNAALTPRARLRLALFVVDDGHTVSQAAVRFEVSYRTAKRWVERYLELSELGPVTAADMKDQSSRPHRSAKTPPKLVRKIVSLRRRKRWGPVEIGDALGVPASTVHAVLVRCRLNRLSHLDRLTGEVVRRYEHERPGDLLHVDVKKLGRIPDGGGWRVHGRAVTAAAQHRLSRGWDFIHVAVDDCTRLAYAEVLPDEKGETCAQFLHRAVAWFREQGVTVRRVLTDNALTYRCGTAWAAVCSALQIRRRFTKPRHPWTNGKAERFNRTLQTEWAYSKPWTSNADRGAALAPWLEHYNTERAHTALAGATPASRLAA